MTDADVRKLFSVTRGCDFMIRNLEWVFCGDEKIKYSISGCFLLNTFF